jgi:hypothetical protein
MVPGTARPPDPAPWVWVVVAVVVALAVILPSVELYLFQQQLLQGLESPSPPESAPMELQFSGPVCPGWTNETTLVPVGGGAVSFWFTLTVQASTGACTAENVSIPTPGFAVLSSNTPVTVRAGSVGSLNVTVTTPTAFPIETVTMIVTVGAVSARPVVP